MYRGIYFKPDCEFGQIQSAGNLGYCFTEKECTGQILPPILL